MFAECPSIKTETPLRLAQSELVECRTLDQGWRICGIMARWLTILVAMVAQGMALMGPVYLVRCVAPSGHMCLELVGHGCHCLSQKHSPEVCHGATCGHHHDDEDQNEQDVAVGWQVRCENCSCQHSPLEAGSQVQPKSLASDELSQSEVFVPTPKMLDLIVMLRALENASLQRSLFRLHESPHLVAAATVVMRV